MNIFRYSLAELFLLMAYCAVITWSFSFNWMAGMLSLGAFIGAESARKTKYGIFLMVPAGLMTALLFIVAIRSVIGARFGPDHSFVKMWVERLASGGRVSPLLETLDIVIWLCAFSSLFWFIHVWSTVKDVNDSAKQGDIMRAELESIVQENREPIAGGLADESDPLDVVS